LKVSNSAFTGKMTALDRPQQIGIHGRHHGEPVNQRTFSWVSAPQSDYGVTVLRPSTSRCATSREETVRALFPAPAFIFNGESGHLDQATQKRRAHQPPPRAVVRGAIRPAPWLIERLVVRGYRLSKRV
jgi:hypothetical protein